MNIIKFIPQSPYATPLYSDTLFNLICWGARWIYSDALLQEWLDGFMNGSPPFLISSAFPFQESKESSQFYLPKPILPIPPIKKNRDQQRIKDFRRIQYLTLTDFQAVINGEQTLWELFIRENLPKPLKAEHDLLTYNCIDRLSWNTLGPHGQVYQEPVFYFTRPPDPNTSYGLYAWLKTSDEITKKIETIWRYWGDVGVGKNASIGLGKFRISLATAPVINTPPSASQFITLSLYNPTPAEIQAFVQYKSKVWYQLAIRKGRIGGVVYKSPNPFKPKVICFTEGSVFPDLKQPFYGQTSLITQRDHPIYQYGYAFTLPVQIKEAQP